LPSIGSDDSLLEKKVSALLEQRLAELLAKNMIALPQQPQQQPQQQQKAVASYQQLKQPLLLQTPAAQHPFQVHQLAQPLQLMRVLYPAQPAPSPVPPQHRS